MRSALPTLVIAAATSTLAAQQFPGSLDRLELPTNSTIGSIQDIAIGDVDGDRVPDLVLAASGGSRIYLQGKSAINSPTFTGHGAYTDVTSAQPPTLSWGLLSSAVALGDMDGDGDLDVILGTGNLSLEMIYLANDGSGRFPTATPVPLFTPNWNVGSIELGDVDGDGDLDIVAGTFAFNGTANIPRPLLLLNDGSANFTDVTQTQLPVTANALSGDSQERVLLLDDDGDGDLDIFLARWPNVFAGAGSTGQEALFRNNGSGTFADATALLPVAMNASSDADFGDVDGDGDLDIVVGNASASNQLYLNGGAAGYALAPAAAWPVDGFETTGIRLVDVDEDCDLDAIFSNDSFGQTMARTTLYLNDGTGAFAAAPTNRVFDDSGISMSALEVADVEGDGDADIVLGPRFGNGLALYPNLHRDLDAPRIHTVSSSSTYDLEIWQRPGYGSTLEFFALFVDVATLSPFVQFPVLRDACAVAPPQGGDLWGLTAAAPALVLNQPATPGSTTFSIPTNPAFMGNTGYFQTIMSDATIFTNPALAQLYWGPVVRTEFQ